MKFFLVLILIVLPDSACVKAQDTSAPQKSAVAPTPVPQPTSLNSSDKLSPKLQTKLSSRVSRPLEVSQMKKVLLNTQPQNIIKTIHFFEDDDKLTSQNSVRRAKNKEVYIFDADLNNDGVNERIVYDDRLKKPDEDSASLPYLCIFKLENNVWKFLQVINGDIAADENAAQKQPIFVEFLSSGIKGDFDITRVTNTSYANNERTNIVKTVSYFALEKDGFDGEVLYPEMKGVYSKDTYTEIR